MALDALDRKLLNIVQGKFPITSKPYEAIAFSLGISEKEVIERLTKLKENNLIKQIRGIFDYDKLGYQGILCAVAVAEKDIKEVAEFLNKYQGVTHNYLRNHYFNIWFTLIAPSPQASQTILQEIEELERVEKLLVLPSSQVFKIKVYFDFNEVEDEDTFK